MKLVSKIGRDLQVAGWQRLSELFDINIKKRQHINFYTDGKQKIHWWFAAIEIKDNQERQAYKSWKNVNRNSAVRDSLMTALIKRGFDTDRINNPEYLAARMLMLNMEDFRTGTEVHDLLVMIRTDVNRTVEKIADDWNMSPQLVSYWKMRMRKERVIDIEKFAVESEYTGQQNIAITARAAM